MDIAITARGLDITDRFREYVAEKAEKVESLAPKTIALEIKVSRHAPGKGPDDDRVELTVIGPGPLVRAEASAADKYAAFDVALAKLIERIRQSKDRRKVHRGRHRPMSIAEAATDGFAAVGVTPASVDVIRAVSTGSVPVAEEQQEQEWSPVVIRRKVFPSSVMTAEEALDHMELVGHDFFLFIDAETDRPSVVYRRKGWAYGVISLDAVASAAAAPATKRRRRA